MLYVVEKTTFVVGFALLDHLFSIWGIVNMFVLLMFSVFFYMVWSVLPFRFMCMNNSFEPFAAFQLLLGKNTNTLHH